MVGEDYIPFGKTLFSGAKILVSGMVDPDSQGSLPPATWYCDSPQWIDIAHYKPRLRPAFSRRNMVGFSGGVVIHNKQNPEDS